MCEHEYKDKKNGSSHLKSKGKESSESNGKDKFTIELNTRSEYSEMYHKTIYTDFYKRINEWTYGWMNDKTA